MKPEPEVQAFAMQNMGKMKKHRIVECKEQGEEEKMQRGWAPESGGELKGRVAAPQKLEEMRHRGGEGFSGAVAEGYEWDTP